MCGYNRRFYHERHELVPSERTRTEEKKNKGGHGGVWGINCFCLDFFDNIVYKNKENDLMKTIKKSLRKINYRLYFAILLTMLLPTVYQTVRIYFLGNMPSDWGINIASQLSWINLIYEVIQEALILPLFFIFGKSLDNDAELENIIKSGLLLTGIIYSVLSFIILIFAKQFVIAMAQNNELVDQTVFYIRLETIAGIFSTLTRFLMLVFINMSKSKYMYILLALQMVLSIIFDTFLISDLTISLKIGVNGIAISNIATNIIIIIIGIVLLNKINIHIFNRKKISFTWVKEWYRVGKFSGLESFVRNLAFMIMIIRMANVISEQGSYWVANTFIWNWLLLPSLALADLIKKEIAENKENIKNNTRGYVILSTVFVALWIVSIPLWKPFLQYVMNVSDFETVYYITLIQTAFYITFIYNNICDSTFYGLGRTDYMLYQSLIVNVFYYGCTFVLYVKGVFIPSLFSISMLFGFGMVLDLIPTLVLYFLMLKKMSIKICEIFGSSD
jgi:Na+-driven multidrug efflux pump